MVALSCSLFLCSGALSTRPPGPRRRRNETGCGEQTVEVTTAVTAARLGSRPECVHHSVGGGVVLSTPYLSPVWGLGAFVGPRAAAQRGRLPVLCSALMGGFVQTRPPTSGTWGCAFLRGTDDLSRGTWRKSQQPPTSHSFSCVFQELDAASDVSPHDAHWKWWGVVPLSQAKGEDGAPCPRPRGGSVAGPSAPLGVLFRWYRPLLSDQLLLAVLHERGHPPSPPCISVPLGGLPACCSLLSLTRGGQGGRHVGPNCPLRCPPGSAPSPGSLSYRCHAEVGVGFGVPGPLVCFLGFPGLTPSPGEAVLWAGPLALGGSTHCCTCGLIVPRFLLRPTGGSLPSQEASRPLSGCAGLTASQGSRFTPGKCSISKRSSHFLKCNVRR